jgi:hypothetical protein
MELDARRLYLGEGCSSLFTYCTHVLHLAEGAAYNRIEASRAARRFPVILEWLDAGDVTLTAVRLLAPHLTAENHRDVLASARQKSTREVERLVAALHPKPPAPTVIRKEPASSVPSGAEELVARQVEAPPPAHQTSAPLSAPANRQKRPSPTLTALAPERYRLQLTVSGATHDKLRRAQDLLRHAVPDGDPAEILDRALTALLEQLERRRFAECPTPRVTGGGGEHSRHIPAAVRRAVWRRDEGRCAFVGTAGRCTERGFLEFHHVEPFAAGGAATVDNIELRCTRHNAYEASLFFGGDGAGLVREAHRAWTVARSST